MKKTKLQTCTLKRNHILRPDNTRYPLLERYIECIVQHLLSKRAEHRKLSQSRSRVLTTHTHAVIPHLHSHIPIRAMHQHTVEHHSYTWSRADGQLEQATHTHSHDKRNTPGGNSQSHIEDTDMQCIHRSYPQ